MKIFNSIGIQSKLILALLLVSLVSISVVSWLGYTSAEKSMIERIQNQLISQRIEKTHVLQNLLVGVRNQLISTSERRVCIDAMREFREAYQLLDKSHLQPDQDQKLSEFYGNVFVPELQKRLGSDPTVEQYLPKDVTSRYLHYQYIANNPAPYQIKQDFPFATDGSLYSDVHRKYHQPIFDKIAKLSGLTDILLVDPDTMDVVYTYQKTIEFATNLNTGPFSQTNLSTLVQAVKKANTHNYYKLVDFEVYVPDWGRPAAFIGTPVYDGYKMIGVLVFQFPIDEITRTMTGGFSWEKEGMGKTGEVYLVGRDHTMRSRSRFMVENRDQFLATLRNNGISQSIVKTIEHQGNVLLALPVSSASTDEALRGKEGITTTRDYRNVEVMSAYGPIDLDSLRWAVLAEMDVSEALAPVRQFARDVIVSGAGLALFTSLFALWIARYLVRPIQQLADGARRVASGEEGVRVDVETNDEFRALADAFNAMASTIQAKTHLLEQKVHENEELLLNILPASAAARMRDGDIDTAEQHADVSVLFADLIGVEECGPEQSLGLLNDLVVAFDEAAEQVGVEKVKTIGSSYLAVCGLSVQRPDHVNRILEFGQDMIQIVNRFNTERSLNLAIEIGVNAGPVVGGIVGRNKFIYDLWGDTVTIARGINVDGISGIVVTNEVYLRQDGTRSFSPGEDIEVKGKGKIKTWNLET